MNNCSNMLLTKVSLWLFLQMDKNGCFIFLPSVAIMMNVVLISWIYLNVK